MKFNGAVVGKMASYFKQKLDVKPHRTGWLRQGVCPSCGKEKKFGVNPMFDRTNCFSCGYHPRPMHLIMQLEGFSTISEVYKYLQAFEGTDYLEGSVELLEEKKVTLPESFTLLSLGESSMGKAARAYMRKRGYKIEDLVYKGVGYCSTGNYKGRIIVPYYRAGVMVYFNARQFINLGGGSHKNPGKDETGVGKSMVMYNSDCLFLYDSCYLVESATNALTLGDRAFATGGKLLSNYQLDDIIKSPCRKITIILDPDARWEALKLGLELVKHKKVRIAFFPMDKKPGTDKYLDVNDYGKKKSLELIKRAKYYTYQEIYRMYLNEERPLHALPQLL